MFHSQHHQWAQAGETPELTQEQDSSAPHRYPVIYICTPFVPLVRCFDAEIKSISTGSRTTATFLVAKGTIKSRPFLGLDTCVELGLLHLTNATHEKKTEMASQTSASCTDPVVTKLTAEYHKVFSGLGKHKSIKAELIVNKDVHPVAQTEKDPLQLSPEGSKRTRAT